LIGQRWASIVIDPRPLLAGRGMVTVFPWIIPGAAGMLLACWPRRGAGRVAAANVLVAAALRPLPDGDGVLTLPAGARFAAGLPWRAGVLRVQLAMPCFVVSECQGGKNYFFEKK
jgi:hypothetical protein